MLDEKGSLEYLSIYSFLFLNEKGSILYNAYDWDEVINKLVIKIDQDDQAPKFSIADNISEVYSLPVIHEYINSQKPLKAVIDIDASKGDMEIADIKRQEVFIRIWLIITTSSDPSKYSYHILYISALLIDHHELKAFTKLVYSLTGKKFGKYIDRGLPSHNFNLRLISSAKKSRVKCILQFLLDNRWNELDHARVQPLTSLELEVRPRILSTEKNNDLLRISVRQDILQKCADLVLQKYSKYLRDWTIEKKEETKENFIYFNRKASLECSLQTDECRKVFECDPSIAKKIQQKNKNSSQVSRKVKGLGFPKAFIEMPTWVKYNETLMATEIYKERYVRSLSNEGDIYVGSP
ncbi:12364_t:CDS:2 [Funneliformis geosporum]|uniref:12364_t:CDS:1 n=1 Tax=Funneliformis geosporum TaxID=1117311 RepID=A0A9W4WYT0_9GLOM|nr:12364_t:CDS:2 [Funneliformis geosporum]